MEFLIIGLATAFNFIIIKIKLEKHRWEDAVVDIVFFGLMTIMFMGTYAGMVVATISSAVCSLYLLFSPPKFIKELL